MPIREEQKIADEARERVAKHMAGLDSLIWDLLTEEHRRIYRGDAGLAIAIQVGPIFWRSINGFRAAAEAAVKAIIENKGPARGRTPND
jgi:hypothetical protein